MEIKLLAVTSGARDVDPLSDLPQDAVVTTRQTGAAENNPVRSLGPL